MHPDCKHRENLAWSEAHGVGGCHAPVNWIATDLGAAKARGARHFFLFGHKPASTYAYGNPSVAGESGFDADPANQSAFIDLLNAYGATYFCGHEHTMLHCIR